MLSLAEEEYVATTTSTYQAMWLRRVLSDLQQRQEELTLIYCDSTSTIALSKNHVFHPKKRKHIDTRYHFIREPVNKGDICLEPCKTQNQLGDIFTKPLTIDVFKFHKRNL